MVNTSLARYCTPAAERWPREIAEQMKQPPRGTFLSAVCSLPPSPPPPEPPPAARTRLRDLAVRERTLSVIKAPESNRLDYLPRAFRVAFRSAFSALSQPHYNFRRAGESQSTAAITVEHMLNTRSREERSRVSLGGVWSEC